MSPRTTTIERCRPAQLKALLALAASPSAEGPELAVQLPKSPELRRVLAELFENDPAGGELLLATVTARTASLTELRLVKDLAKGLLGRAPTPSHRNAATLLYHAAVAAAYAEHGVNISKQAMAARGCLYKALAERLAGDPLASVFQRALGRALQHERTVIEPDSS